MPFELFPDVILTTDLPEEALKAGDVARWWGATACRDRKQEDGYGVELFGMTGETVAVVTVRASLLRSPHARRPASGESHRGRGMIAVMQ